MLRKLMHVAVVASMITFSIAAASPASAVSQEPQKIVDPQLLLNPSGDKRVIVKYRPEAAAAKKASKKKYKDHKKYKHINLEAMTVSQEELKELINDSNILSIEEDAIGRGSAQTEDWGIARIQAPQGWTNGLTGDNIKVAVLDSGIADHDDLVIQSKVNFTDSTSTSDIYGHGTHVAGIIAAKNNSIGTVGAAPDVLLYSAKVLGDNNYGYYSWFIDGIDWAIDNNMDIINMSLSGESYSSAFEDACDAAYDNGILILAAAGNNSSNTSSDDPDRYPAAFDSVIAVANATSTDERNSSSNKGPHLELTGPGTSVYSTYNNNGYTYMTGTSMATPYAAGIAAQYMEQYPTYTVAQIRAKLAETAQDLGAPGRDSSYGYGMVQAPYSVPIGDGLFGQYYNNADLTSLVTTRKDAKVDFNWGSGSPVTGVDADSFSVRWIGQVLPKYTETYTFYTSTDDGVRLWVNGTLLIDHWVNQALTEYSGTISLTAGQKYDIKMEYYDNAYDAAAYLSWSSSSQSKQIIPKNQLFAVLPAPATPTGLTATAGTSQASLSWSAASNATGYNVKRSTSSGGPYTTVGTNVSATSFTDTGLANNTTYYYVVSAVNSTGESANSAQASVTLQTNGLLGQYYDNADLTNLITTRTDANVNFNWGTGSPASGVGSDTFSVRWTGKVAPLYTETYTFYTNTDDGVRLWVNGSLLIDHWVDQGATEYSGTITLNAGQKYDIKMEYYDNIVGAVAQLSWSSSSQSKQIIPSSQLFIP
ncbi:S8 family serine peptidase [Paenibacillus oenotherae]|uniref:S8 family serine peptidase n=1 Tax=Paenibacillus oenotherae TaxID=1435645 RepID=A0ABS7D2K8_9BACL|nr:S8 family serine peptidase [Paenibacillus oenotherae]